MKKLKLNKAKLAFDMLEKEMSVINSPEELKGYLGGQQANDCVIAVFNSLDGPSDSSMTYQNSMMMNLGYNTYLLGSTGTTGGGIAANNGVKPEDIATVGAYGGLTVTDMQPGGSSGGGISLTSNGRTLSGNHVMVTFNNGSGQDHAVILTGAANGTMTYYDPQNNTTGDIVNGQYSGMYEISSSSSSGSSGN